MGGVYVAQSWPAEEDPDVPPGWDWDWQFPGPFPPGYTPEYSLNLSATESIAYDGTATATVSLRDHVTYTTTEPLGSSITWIATIDGESVGLRFSGDEDYSSSLVSSYSEGATYWGAEPEIEFELTESNNGDIIVLTAISIVSGQEINNSANIQIFYVYKVEITITDISFDFPINNAIIGDVELCILRMNDDISCSYAFSRVEYEFEVFNPPVYSNGTSFIVSPIENIVITSSQTSLSCIFDTKDLYQDTITILLTSSAYEGTGDIVSTLCNVNIIVSIKGTDTVVYEFNGTLSAITSLLDSVVFDEKSIYIDGSTKEITEL